MRIIAAVLALVLLAGCATRRGEAAASAADAQYVVINNNLTIPSGVTVWAVSRDGVRDRIARVSPFQRSRVRLNIPVTQLHRFVARTDSNDEIFSPVVLFAPGDSYDWDLQANALYPSR